MGKIKLNKRTAVSLTCRPEAINNLTFIKGFLWIQSNLFEQIQKLRTGIYEVLYVQIV